QGLVGHGHPAVLVGEGEVLRPCLLEEALGLRPACPDVLAVAGELLELGGRGGPRRPRPLDARHVLDAWALWPGLGALVGVESQGQGAAYALVPERLLLMVEGDQDDAVPGALLHGDLVAEGLHDAVPLRGAEAAELRVRPLAPHGGDHGRRRGHEDGAVTVE